MRTPRLPIQEILDGLASGGTIPPEVTIDDLRTLIRVQAKISRSFLSSDPVWSSLWAELVKRLELREYYAPVAQKYNKGDLYSRPRTTSCLTHEEYGQDIQEADWQAISMPASLLSGGDSDAPAGAFPIGEADSDVATLLPFWEDAVVRNREYHINKVSGKMVRSHVRVYQTAVPLYRSLVDQGKTLVIYGRDTIFLHLLLAQEGIAHIYLEGVSRKVMGKRELAQYSLACIAKEYEVSEKEAARLLLTSVHVDTGFQGSVPLAFCWAVAAYIGCECPEIEIKMLSSSMEDYSISCDISRSDVIDIEHSPKAFLRVVELEPDGSVRLVRSADFRAAEVLWDRIQAMYWA